MKKVLFATTALVASAGIASADDHAITLGGSAAAGVASLNGADPLVYSEIELDIIFAGETDNGLTFGAQMDINVGMGFDLEDNEFDNNTGIASHGSVFISGDFGTITFDPNGLDDLVDDTDGAHDVSYAYSGGPLSFDMTVDVDNGNGESSISAKAGYSDNGLTISLSANDADDMDLDFAYALNDMFTIDGKHDIRGGGAGVTTIGFVYTSGGITVDASAADNNDWDLSLGYAMDAVSVTASTDEASAWEIMGTYDLGGGLAMGAGVNSMDSWFLGATMSF